jgi:hypothetical protein
MDLAPVAWFLLVFQVMVALAVLTGIGLACRQLFERSDRDDPSGG